ncbi:MAG: DUF433 domain-containing protein [Dehalococcoidia bacterium]|nr:DUF433 domain-containing protein [Dehalococcoidia bacterium]
MAVSTFNVGDLIAFEGDKPVVAGTRIGVVHILELHGEGLSPEEITHELFDVVSVGQVYGALAYYHLNQESVDAYIGRYHEEHDRLAASNPKWPAPQRP